MPLSLSLSQHTYIRRYVVGPCSKIYMMALLKIFNRKEEKVTMELALNVFFLQIPSQLRYFNLGLQRITFCAEIYIIQS